jgi:hypothetical protein
MGIGFYRLFAEHEMLSFKIQEPPQQSGAFAAQDAQGFQGLQRA